MKNLSLNNEPLELNPGKSYFVIDALYLQEIKNELDGKDIRNIRHEIFPYTETPYAELVFNRTTFLINQIKKVEYDEVIPDDYSFFSTDTGLIIFICEDILIKFLERYDFNDLVNSNDETININYWEDLASVFETADLGIILSYIKPENDFDGSGTYKIYQEKE